MATTEATETGTARRNRLGTIALVCAVTAVIGLVLYHFLSRPPQMGTSDEAFNTVDALYTAVRSHNEKRLGECEQRLHTYRDAGKLPAAAADALDAIIRKARSGSWDTAAERLYEFMLAQRRDGALEPRPAKPDPKAKHRPRG